MQILQLFLQQFLQYFYTKFYVKFSCFQAPAYMFPSVLALNRQIMLITLIRIHHEQSATDESCITTNTKVTNIHSKLITEVTKIMLNEAK